MTCLQPYEASTVSGFQRVSTVFEPDARVRRCICSRYDSHIHQVESAPRHGKSLCVFPTRRIHNMMCSRPRARRKYFLPKSTLDSWACTRNSQPLATGRDESFPHVVGRLFRTCGVGVRPCTRNRTKCAAGVLAGHSAIAFRRRESRRGSTIVEGVIVMAKGYSMCVRAVLGQYIGSPWRGVPGDNHHSIPGN